MDFTRGSWKSQSRSGAQKGAKNPPEAASTWIGIFKPFFFSSSSKASATSFIGSYCPVKVIPKVITTPIVFSSHLLRTSSALEM